MQSISILMVADVDPVHVIGGAERMLNEHCRRLAARGHQVTVLTRRENEGYPPEELYEGVRVVRHPVSGGGGPVGFIRSVLREGGKAFVRLLDGEQFDLINVHQPLAANAVLRRPESRGLPVLYTYLSPWSDEYRIRFGQQTKTPNPAVATVRRAWMGANCAARQRMERFALDRSDRIMVLSEFTTTQLQEIHGLGRERVSIIPGGVDTQRFRPPTDRNDLRQEFGFGDAPALLTVRNLVPRMGLDALIGAMCEVVDQRPDCRLFIGGQGALRPELEAQVRALRLEANVRFLGFIPEDRLPDYYGAADAFVLPTRCLEGFGLVTVEALACGTPALGTPIGGTREILRDFDERFLFEDTSAGAMTRRILERLPEILENQTLRDRALRFAEARYSWDTITSQVEVVMREAITSGDGVVSRW